MKKITLFLFALLIGVSTYAQQVTTTTATNGLCDGSATLQNSNQFVNWKWYKNDTLKQTGGSTFSNLCVGSYSVITQDTSMAYDTAAFSIVTNNPCNGLTLSISSTNESAPGACDGTLSANFNGYTTVYNWSDTSLHNAQNTGICAGQYTLTVTDTGGCQKTAAAYVGSDTTNNNPCNGLTLTISATNESAPGACDGTLSANFNGYTTAYNWSDTSLHNAQNTGVCAGQYTLTVTDTSGCQKTAAAYVGSDTTNNNPCNGLTLSISATNESAPGACDGTLSANFNGYTTAYIWSDSTLHNAQNTGICAGQYTLTVTDTSGCQKTATAYVSTDTTNNNPCNGLTLSISATNESAPGACDGTLSANFNGYTTAYIWSDSTLHNAQNTGICAGQYTLTVTDTSGCQKTATAYVSTDTTNNNPCNGLTLSISATNESAPGACDGILSANFNGYTTAYIWSDSTLHNAQNTGICAGQYTLTVTDTSGCQKTATAYVSTDTTQAPCNAFTASIASVDETTTGACDGSLTVTTNGFAVSYVWSDSTFQNANVTNVCAGVYTVIVTDSSGCQVTDTATVGTGGSNPCANFSVTISSTINQTFPGACNGMATAAVNNGSAPFLFNWGSGLTSTSPQFSGLCDGNFTLTITDAAGCSTSTVGLVGTDSVTGPCNGVAITVSLTQVSATAGACDGSATSSVIGGTSPYLYFWNNGYHTSSLVNVCPGYYNVQVKDINGCLGAASVLVQGDTSVPVPLTISITTNDVDSAGACNGNAYINAAGGLAPYSITYSTGISGSQATNLCAGYYYAYATDANGQSDSLSFVISSPENTYNGNTQDPLNDSVVVATLTTEALQSCTIDFTTIDSIAVTNYFLGNNDSIVVQWTIYSTISGDTLLTQLYGVGPFGVYEVVLSIYCEGRTVEGFAKAYGKILVNSELPTGVATAAKASQTVVYPNPFNNEVNMSLSIATEVSLTDITGKTVFATHANAGSLKIDAANLAKGVYFIYLQNAAGREVSKLVKE